VDAAPRSPGASDEGACRGDRAGEALYRS